MEQSFAQLFSAALSGTDRQVAWQKSRVKLVARSTAKPSGASFMALGDGRHKLPVKASLRESLGKQAGEVAVRLLKERL